MSLGASMPSRQCRLDAVILAGGRGTRLLSIAKSGPKVLVPVADKPFLHYLLDLLQRNGFRRAVLCVGYGGDLVECAFGERTPSGLKLCYSRDGARPLGTAGAIRAALPLTDERFWVLNGDTYLDIDYASVEASYTDAENVAVVFENANAHWPSNMLVRNGRVIRYDKFRDLPDARHIDAGTAIMQASVFDEFRHCHDLCDIFSLLAAQGRLAAALSAKRFWEINTPDSYRQTAAHLLGL
jgi:NDP-sugar pyrophosphorylase family protein